MKDTPTNHSSNLQEDIDKDVQDFQKYKEEHEAQQKKELAEDIQKFEERPRPPWYEDPMAMSMRGAEDQDKEPAEGDPLDHAGHEASEASKQAGPEPSLGEESVETAGTSSISPGLLAAIAEAIEKQSPEERKQAVAEMNKKFRNEINNIGGVVEDGQGVTFTDFGRGKKYTISYE
jgi:hypothetical protein